MGLLRPIFDWYGPNRQSKQVPIHFLPAVIPPSDEKQGKSATLKFKILPTVKKKSTRSS
jgi:hypothetical protein